MKQVTILLGFLGFAACARLDHLENRYLPPPSTKRGPGSSHQPLKAPGGGAPRRGQAPGRHVASTTTPVPILHYENTNDGNGNYHFAYEAGNGIQANEQGHLEGAGSENEGINVQGSYSYPAPDGSHIVIHYVANENGFQPSGDHLPTPPPIPEEIQRALERNAAEEAEGVSDDGQYRSEHHGEQPQARAEQGYQYKGPQYLPPRQ